MKSVDSSLGVIFVFLSTPDVSKLSMPLFGSVEKRMSNVCISFGKNIHAKTAFL